MNDLGTGKGTPSLLWKISGCGCATVLLMGVGLFFFIFFPSNTDFHPVILLYPASLLFVVFIFYGLYRYLLARRNEMQQVAEKLGFSVQSTLTWNETTEFLSWLPKLDDPKEELSSNERTFLPLRIDAEPQNPDPVAQFLGTMPVYNLLRGERDGFEINLFDFSSQALGQRKKGLSTKILIRSENLTLPPFLLRPEMLRDTFYSQIPGWQDIDFPGDYPIFSAHYVLQGTDEDALRKFFSHNTITYFERNQSSLHNIIIEGQGAGLLINAGRVSASEMEAFMELSIEIAKVFSGT